MSEKPARIAIVFCIISGLLLLGTLTDYEARPNLDLALIEALLLLIYVQGAK